MFSIASMPSTSLVLSVHTTSVASAVLVRAVLNEVQSMTNQILPKAFQDRMLSKLGFLIGDLSIEMSVIIDELNGYALNQMFEAAEIYLRTKFSSPVEKLKVSKASRRENTVYLHEGMNFFWKLVCVETLNSNYNSEGFIYSENVESKTLYFSFNKKFKDTVLNSYLSYVLERSKSVKEENKTIKLNSLGNFTGDYVGTWRSINYEHPSTFDTLAMDPEVKKNLMDDLDRFVRRRHFYMRGGKAWKRGYLLYGPQGTGKSSLIAAMANHLKFDIYDMELTSLYSNSELRRLLVSTKNRSILVIENIDYNIDLDNNKQVEMPIVITRQLAAP